MFDFHGMLALEVDVLEISQRRALRDTQSPGYLPFRSTEPKTLSGRLATVGRLWRVSGGVPWEGAFQGLFPGTLRPIGQGSPGMKYLDVSLDP